MRDIENIAMPMMIPMLAEGCKWNEKNEGGRVVGRVALFSLHTQHFRAR